MSIFSILNHPRLDFQPFCEPAFPAPHHGWITGLPIVFFDQSQPSLLKSSRLPCDWSILSLVYPTWRMSVLMSFFLQSFLQSVFQYGAPSVPLNIQTTLIYNTSITFLRHIFYFLFVYFLFCAFIFHFASIFFISLPINFYKRV